MSGVLRMTLRNDSAEVANVTLQMMLRFEGIILRQILFRILRKSRVGMIGYACHRGVVH